MPIKNIFGSAAASTVQPPAPTSESVSSGGTPANKTFSAFTDAGGVIASYAASITNIAGTTSISSGTGLGPYVVTGSADGDAYVLYLDAKDSSGNVVATAIYGVRIASGAAWGDLLDLDYTGLDIATLTTSSTAVTKSAVQYGPAVKVVEVSGTSAVCTTGAAGVTLSGGGATGSLNFGAILDTYFDFAKAFYSPMRLDIYLTNLTDWTGTTDGLNAGYCDATMNFSSAVQERSVRFDWAAGGLMNIKTSRNNVTGTILNNQTVPAGTWCHTVVLYRAISADNFFTVGSIPSDATIQAGGTLVTANTSPIFPSTVYGGFRVIYRTGATLTRIRLRTIE